MAETYHVSIAHYFLWQNKCNEMNSMNVFCRFDNGIGMKWQGDLKLEERRKRP